MKSYKTLKKLSIFISVMICGVFLLSACGGDKLSVNTEFRRVSFDSYKTYRWYEKTRFDKEGKITEITYDYIKQSIETELRTKGFRHKPDGAVDFYVDFKVTADVKYDTKNYEVYSGIAPGLEYSGDRGFEYKSYTEPRTEYIYYRDGTLLIDVIDPFSDKLVWRGEAKKRLPKKKESSQKKREQLLDRAVAAVLANFPPTEKK